MESTRQHLVLSDLASLVKPLLEAQGLELFDLELTQGALRISVDTADGSPVDLEAVTNATKAINAVLDEADPIEGQYTLEVGSPGLERPLRTPEHFRRFVGAIVSVKTKPDVEGDRRMQGPLEAADDGGIVVGGRRLAYGQIDNARTVFEWGGQPKKATKPKEKKAAS
jgi:ribosome maturation factor RimP